MLSLSQETMWMQGFGTTATDLAHLTRKWAIISPSPKGGGGGGSGPVKGA